MEILLAGAFGLLLGIVGMWTGRRHLKALAALDQWPVATGKVIERGTFRPTHASLSKSAFMHAPLVRYGYQIGGKEFGNNRLHPQRIQQPEHLTQKWAQAQAASFPDEVAVHYNPADPAEFFPGPDPEEKTLPLARRLGRGAAVWNRVPARDRGKVSLTHPVHWGRSNGKRDSRFGLVAFCGTGKRGTALIAAKIIYGTFQGRACNSVDRSTALLNSLSRTDFLDASDAWVTERFHIRMAVGPQAQWANFGLKRAPLTLFRRQLSAPRDAHANNAVRKERHMPAQIIYHLFLGQLHS